MIARRRDDGLGDGKSPSVRIYTSVCSLVDQLAAVAEARRLQDTIVLTVR